MYGPSLPLGEGGTLMLPRSSTARDGSLGRRKHPVRDKSSPPTHLVPWRVLPGRGQCRMSRVGCARFIFGQFLHDWLRPENVEFSPHQPVLSAKNILEPLSTFFNTGGTGQDGLETPQKPLRLN